MAADLFENESYVNWKRPGVKPADVRTEVFLLPAASAVEKEGSIVNSGRWVQWRYAATKPLGQSLPDTEILTLLAHALKQAYAKGGVRPEPIVHLAWDYGKDHAAVHAVAKEINGRFLADVTTPDGATFKAGSQVPAFAALRADGTTASGNWIYCGSYTEQGNMAARCDTKDAPNNIGLYPGWAWAWPANRHILYNRASLSPAGQPWNPRRWVIRWNAQEKKWEGDVPDGGGPPEAIHPFIMTASGRADGDLLAGRPGGPDLGGRPGRAVPRLLVSRPVAAHPHRAAAGPGPEDGRRPGRGSRPGDVVTDGRLGFFLALSVALNLILTILLVSQVLVVRDEIRALAGPAGDQGRRGGPPPAQDPGDPGHPLRHVPHRSPLLAGSRVGAPGDPGRRRACTRCHSEAVLSRLALQTPDEQVSTIRRMQRLPDSGIRADQIPEIVRAFRTLSGQQ